MKTMKKLTYFLFFGFAAVTILVSSCSKQSNLESTNQKMSTSGISPVVVSGANNGGNVTCDEAAQSSGISGYAFTTGKQDYPFSSDSFGNGVEVTTDGTNVSWSITPPAGFCVSNVAVIVKGGPSANVYYYNDGQSSDSGLASPVNASGNPAGLSNLTICYNLVECDQNECNWQEETAFGGDVAGAGNAWWFAIDASTSGSYPIYAGQQEVEGASVSYNAVTDQITIVLGGQMQLQDVSEPVKVEGYNQLPSERPAAGLFELYKGNNLTIQGNSSSFYVVHLDVEVCN
jgi:hypothetical protein